MGANKGKILNIYLERENAINKFAVAVEKEGRFDHLSIKVRIKGWYSCQGAEKNVRNSEMFEITGFEISSIDYKSFLR